MINDISFYDVTARLQTGNNKIVIFQTFVFHSLSSQGLRVIPYINTLVWVDGSRSSESDKIHLSHKPTDDDDVSTSSYLEPQCLALNPRNASWDYSKCTKRKHYVCKLRCKKFPYVKGAAGEGKGRGCFHMDLKVEPVGHQSHIC